MLKTPKPYVIPDLLVIMLLQDLKPGSYSVDRSLPSQSVGNVYLPPAGVSQQDLCPSYNTFYHVTNPTSQVTPVL